ncbi:MAG: hypothetical protein Q3999_02250 [Buchananella hordeovulneris]|nr:hypothetical protein [Buchananella hordeovulneris]
MTETNRPQLGVPRAELGNVVPAATQSTPAAKHSGCGCGGRCGGGKKKRSDRAPIGVEAEGRAELGLRAAK